MDCSTGCSVWTVLRKFCYLCMSESEHREVGQKEDGGGFLGVETLCNNQMDGGLQPRLSGKGSVSFPVNDPSFLVSQSTDTSATALKTAPGAVG